MRLASSKIISKDQSATGRNGVSSASLLREGRPGVSRDIPIVVVLAVGFDPLLSEPRRSIQTSRGYIITTTESIHAAITAIHQGDFDLIVLGHRLPIEDQKRLTFLIRSSGCLVPVVCVTNSTGKSTEFSNGSIENDPEALLSGIAEALAGIAFKPSTAVQRRHL